MTRACCGKEIGGQEITKKKQRETENGFEFKWRAELRTFWDVERRRLWRTGGCCS